MVSVREQFGVWRKRVIRSILLIVLVGGSVASMIEQAASTDFLRFVEDLPLAPGLIEDGNEIVVFDKPNGRIVETRASGRLSSAVAVVDFYRQTLPQLGWTPVAAAVNATPNGSIQLNFARTREVLSLLIGTDKGVVVVRFAITPR
jgi:hypothetical protein